VNTNTESKSTTNRIKHMNTNMNVFLSQTNIQTKKINKQKKNVLVSHRPRGRSKGVQGKGETDVARCPLNVFRREILELITGGSGRDRNKVREAVGCGQPTKEREKEGTKDGGRNRGRGRNNRKQQGRYRLPQTHDTALLNASGTRKARAWTTEAFIYTNGKSGNSFKFTGSHGGDSFLIC
jgi:hypothetical protein